MENTENISPLDISTEAALELGELREGTRQDTPALIELFRLIKAPMPSTPFRGHTTVSISMLDDIRSYTLLRDAVGSSAIRAPNYLAFKKIFEDYLSELERGVTARSDKVIEEARRFCLTLSNMIAAKQMDEVYDRRERADSRYVSDESLSQL